MIHSTAKVHPDACIGDDVRIWNWAYIREGATIGDNSIISKGVYIDSRVRIGRNVKIQNDVSVYEGVTIEDGVFIGPHVCFTNDRRPRAVNIDGSLKTESDWEITLTVIRYGCSIGANSTIIPGVTVGRFSMVGAGSVVTHDVPDYGLVVGNPARLIGYVCPCGERLVEKDLPEHTLYCVNCEKAIKIG